jgi:hypothetical protein
MTRLSLVASGHTSALVTRKFPKSRLFVNLVAAWTLIPCAYVRSLLPKVRQAEDRRSPPWDYNVAPTTMQPIIRQSRDTGERKLVSLRWGPDSVLYPEPL